MDRSSPRAPCSRGPGPGVNRLRDPANRDYKSIIINSFETRIERSPGRTAQRAFDFALPAPNLRGKWSTFMLTGEWNTSRRQITPKGRNPFVELPKMSDDRAALIVHRSAHAYLVLNRFPYNAGHLLAIPYREVAELADLEPEERLDLMNLLVSRHRSAEKGAQSGRIQRRAQSGRVRQAPASPAICISTSCPGGAATPISCRSSGKPGSCPNRWRRCGNGSWR